MSKTIYQHSTMGQMVPGLYEGTEKISNILKHGNTGLGTGDALDGELIILEGVPYRATGNGEISIVPADEMIPFLTVHFADFKHFNQYSQIDQKELEKEILKKTTFKNLIFAVKIEGTFKRVKTRTVKKQTKPYVPLTEAGKAQAEFEQDNVEGIMISYHYPAMYSVVTVAGFHHHFLAKDHSIGGHVLNFVLEKGTVSLQEFDTLVQKNPIDNRDFLDADFTGYDMHGDIESVE